MHNQSTSVGQTDARKVVPPRVIQRLHGVFWPESRIFPNGIQFGLEPGDELPVEFHFCGGGGAVSRTGVAEAGSNLIMAFVSL